MGDNEAFFELLLAYIVWFSGNLQVAPEKTNKKLDELGTLLK